VRLGRRPIFRKPGYRGGALSKSLAVAAANLVVNFLAMDRDVGGGGDAQLNHIAIEAHDFDGDAAVDHDAFVEFSGEDQHSMRGLAGLDRQRMGDREFGRVDGDDLFGPQRAAVQHDGAFQIDGGLLCAAQGDDVEDEGV
jgi:hypothetical protein